jgi:hypothetical protein
MMGQRRQLRFGVMCAGTPFAAWEAECLDRLVALENVSLALLIIDKRAEAPRVRPGPVGRVRSLLRSDRILWVLYERLLVDGRIRALELVDRSARLQDVPVLACGVSRRGRFSEYFSASDIEIIRSHELDFILRFAFGIVRGEILQVPRYGIWSFHHDDEMRYRGGPPAFWEIYRGDPHTGVVLQRLTERLDGGVVLRKHAFDTVLHSYTRNRDVGLFGCAAWPAQVCRDLLAGKDEYLGGVPSASTAPIFHTPSNGEMLRFALTLGRNYLLRCIWGPRSAVSTRPSPRRPAEPERRRGRASGGQERDGAGGGERGS